MGHVGMWVSVMMSNDAIQWKYEIKDYLECERLLKYLWFDLNAIVPEKCV